METFKINNLTFAYPEQINNALDGISFEVQQGEFVVICGPSGCGKSTLLRHFKSVLAPHGKVDGEILFQGRALSDIDEREQTSAIGFVQQSPENQIVTDKVWHELAFGLESLGYDTPTIRQKVAEMASFFGIQGWFYKKVTELSGGQKQLLNLASVMTMQPKVLILDEPTAQLDPIAAADFLATLGKINRDLGTTIILTEHRLEEALPLSTSVVYMEQGKLAFRGTATALGKHLKDNNRAMFEGMPASMRIWAGLGSEEECPLTVRDGRMLLERHAKEHELVGVEREGTEVYTKGEPPVIENKKANAKGHGDTPVISAEDIWFKYEKNEPDIVKGLSLQLYKGEFLALLGGNGTGKTTSLKVLAGQNKQYRGEVSIAGRVGVLPQNPQMLFVKKTVREDLFEIFSEGKFSKEEKELQKSAVARMVELCLLGDFLDRHPYDLSGGEQQRLALAKVLLTQPEILMLDEPTKGFDSEFKMVFAGILKKLMKQGISILMVSHDVEFCAKYADRCALFFDGNVVSSANPKEFFSGNSFYTTATNRIAREVVADAVVPEDVMSAFGMQGEITLEENLSVGENDILGGQMDIDGQELSGLEKGEDKLAWWRKLLAVLSGAVALYILIKAVMTTDLTELTMNGMVSELGMQQIWESVATIIALLVLAMSVGSKSQPPNMLQMPKEKRKLRKRTITACVMIVLLIPLTLFIGSYYLGDAKFYFIALLILLECMIPFFLVFEGRKPQARELVILSVMCALGVAGRAAFFMLPQFKPVIAITIITGVALGAESGFLVGSLIMLISNMMFSQGPMLPWQMFSMGIIGFLAGILFKKGLLRRSRLSMSIFGTLMAVVVYGGIMNFASALTDLRTLQWEILLGFYVTGFPLDLVHAAGTFVFLWFGAEPILEKLDRVKLKYGLIQ